MRGERSIEIAATPEQVYAVVSDVSRTGEFSPECRGAEWLDGAAGRPRAPGSSGTTAAGRWRGHAGAG